MLKGVPAARRKRVEPAGAHHLPQPDLASLCAKTEPDFLRQRWGRAHHGGSRVIHPSDRIEVCRKLIMGERLDDNSGAIRF